MNGQSVNSVDSPQTPLLGSSKPALTIYSTDKIAREGSRVDCKSSSLRSRIRRSYRLESLLAVKPIEAFLAEREARPEGHRLAERLGLSDLLGYGVGCTVGAGIYSLIGIGVGIAGNGCG